MKLSLCVCSAIPRAESPEPGASDDDVVVAPASFGVAAVPPRPNVRSEGWLNTRVHRVNDSRTVR